VLAKKLACSKIIPGENETANLESFQFSPKNAVSQIQPAPCAAGIAAMRGPGTLDIATNWRYLTFNDAGEIEYAAT